ncbi:MAG TPA: 4Fe-4S dicluster domain-containing protein [Actinomycetota bacterium]|nr:4Fe-4S dicluster domain-containing protein [Actinomycetota bacterium]
MGETVIRTPTGALAARVRSGSGVNVYPCYQCAKCSTGCPVAAFADVHPAQVIRAVQLGDEAMSVDSRLIWLCTGCETCTTRCPVGVDVASVIEELRIIARHDGRVRRDMPFARMLDLNYRSFRRWGRLYEIELVLLDVLGRPRAALDAMRLGLRMVARGKVRPLPGIGDRRQMRRMSRTAERVEARRRAEARAAATGTAPGASATVASPSAGEAR